MNNKDKQQFANIINKTAILYDKDISETFLNAYWEMLKYLDLAEFQMAMNSHCLNSPYWPKVSDIIEILNTKEPTIEIEARAQQQWAIVVDAIRKNGINRPVVFEDPITKHLINRQFSWQYLCSMKQENENWEQKRFCEAYNHVSDDHVIQLEDYKNITKRIQGV